LIEEELAVLIVGKKCRERNPFHESPATGTARRSPDH
jgi:hypothetical protein